MTHRNDRMDRPDLHLDIQGAHRCRRLQTPHTLTRHRLLRVVVVGDERHVDTCRPQALEPARRCSADRPGGDGDDLRWPGGPTPKMTLVLDMAGCSGAAGAPLSTPARAPLSTPAGRPYPRPPGRVSIQARRSRHRARSSAAPASRRASHRPPSSGMPSWRPDATRSPMRNRLRCVFVASVCSPTWRIATRQVAPRATSSQLMLQVTVQHQGPLDGSIPSWTSRDSSCL